MHIGTILHPTDFSAASREALSVAASLARDNQAHLLIAHVIEPPQTHEALATNFDVSAANVEEQIDKLKQFAPPDPQVSYDHRVVGGAPADAILNLAKSENVDLIVLGTHGRSGLSRLLVGSVAKQVMHRAPCAVLVVKPRSADGEPP